MPNNEIIHCSCNIGTATRLLFTKSLSSEFQECIGKLLFPLKFLQFHIINILVWDECFVWIQNIWFLNDKTSLLSFHGYIFHNPYPIVWLLCLCQLFCINSSFFIQSNELLTPFRVVLCWDIGRTTWYQSLPLVTFRIKSWRRFPSTWSCLPLWFTRKILPLVADSWFHMTITLYLDSFNFFKISR